MSDQNILTASSFHSQPQSQNQSQNLSQSQSQLSELHMGAEIIPLHDTQQSLEEQMMVRSMLKDSQSMQDFDPDMFNTDANLSPPRNSAFRTVLSTSGSISSIGPSSFNRSVSVTSSFLPRTSSVISSVVLSSPKHPRPHVRGTTFDDVLDSQQSVGSSCTIAVVLYNPKNPQAASSF
jgi:hypothetical protein